jgi:hypothetical protein
MREFVDIQQELGFRKFLDSPSGTLYMVLSDRGLPTKMVRHFDRDLAPTLVKPFADLVQALQQWIDRYPELAALVKIEQPIEVGRDFIARPFHIVHAPIDAYETWDDPPEAPEELDTMRRAFRAIIAQTNQPKDALIAAILSRSLLELTSKTYFNEGTEQFIVIEPKVASEDLQQWSEQLQS